MASNTNDTVSIEQNTPEEVLDTVNEILREIKEIRKEVELIRRITVGKPMKVSSN